MSKFCIFLFHVVAVTSEFDVALDSFFIQYSLPRITLWLKAYHMNQR